LFLILGAVLLLAVILGAVLGGVFGSKKDKSPASDAVQNSKTAASNGLWGGDGSVVTMSNGETFIYNNCEFSRPLVCKLNLV
jgi:hypothetical protein